MKLESILQYLDGYLGVRDHPDYPTALNGLQVGVDGDVASIATAVDASEASIRAAAGLGVDLLLVHHGLFWEGLRPMTGRRYRRIATLVESGVALYSCHLPLDAHPEVGNCALLGRALGLQLEGRFGGYEGADIGWWGRLPVATDAAGLVTKLEAALVGPVQALPGGPDRVELVGVVTGGGGSFIGEAAALGLDAFVTGEGSHHNYFDAAEHGIHVLLGGHYATETFGLTATFIDRPTGL